jgi:hypothetical protein
MLAALWVGAAMLSGANTATRDVNARNRERILFNC